MRLTIYNVTSCLGREFLSSALRNFVCDYAYFRLRMIHPRTTSPLETFTAPRLYAIAEKGRKTAYELDAVNPEEGKWKSEEEQGRVNDIKEQFAIAEDYVQLKEEEDKPEKLLSRAERSLEALRKHQTQLVRSPGLHEGVQRLLRIAQDIATACVQSKPRGTKQK